jgi:hypothetical protein
MAAVSTITISGTVTGITIGEIVIGPLSFVSESSPGIMETLTLASGDNPVAIPSGTNIVMIVTTAANTINVGYHHAAADTLTLIEAAYGILVFNPQPAQVGFFLNAASAGAQVCVLFA